MVSVTRYSHFVCSTWIHSITKPQQVSGGVVTVTACMQQAGDVETRRDGREHTYMAHVSLYMRARTHTS